MALPVMSSPTYELTIPSSKKKFKYRAFLVKEEKTLLIAQQSEDQNVMVNTIKDIISSCTFGKINVEELAMFDIEYIFCKLRSKSVGEISELIFNCLECNDAKAKMKISIDLNQLEVEFHDDHKKTIDLFDDVGITMKYPSLDMLNQIKDIEGESIENAFEVIVSCIDHIFAGDEIYPAKEQSKEELTSFLDNLTQEQFKKIQRFFETMPKLEKKVEFDCPVCNYHHSHKIQGIENFF
jgi:hypothetical protein